MGAIGRLIFGVFPGVLLGALAETLFDLRREDFLLLSLGVAIFCAGGGAATAWFHNSPSWHHDRPEHHNMSDGGY
jgi:hypothetical protein